MQKLAFPFYRRNSVCTIARQLLGKLLCTYINGYETVGRIVETEAYNGVVDKASHAYGGRRTGRTEIMYAAGGVAYVYLCYGIHHLFNVVTNVEDVPHAVLVRAVEPVNGIDIMLARMKKNKADNSVGRGPGNVAKALGIYTIHSGTSLAGPIIYIADDGTKMMRSQIIVTPRIGVDYAAADAALPYRFYVQNSGYVSGKK